MVRICVTATPYNHFILKSKECEAMSKVAWSDDPMQARTAALLAGGALRAPLGVKVRPTPPKEDASKLPVGKTLKVEGGFEYVVVDGKWVLSVDLGEEALKCHPIYHGKTYYYGESAYRESMDTEESKDQAKSFEAKVQSMYSSSSTVKYSQAFSGRSRSIALVKDYFEALLDIAKLGKSAGYKPTDPSEKAIFKLWNQKKDGKGDLVVLRLERGRGKGLRDFVQKIQKKIQDVQKKAGGQRFAVLCASDTEGTSSMDPLKFKQQLDSQDKSFLKVRRFFSNL